MKLATAFVAALLAACVPAPDPACGEVRLALGPSLDGRWDFNADQRAAFRANVPLLDALCPRFVLVSEGEADFVVRAASLDDGAAEHYTLGESFGEVDTTHAQGFNQTVRAAFHAWGHFELWGTYGFAGHLCDWAVNVPPPVGCHPTIRCPGEDCLMARGLEPFDFAGPGTTEAYTGRYVDPAPAEPDVTLFRACRAAGRCP